MLCTAGLAQGQPSLIPVHSQYLPGGGEGAVSAQALSLFFFPSCPLISLTLDLKWQISICESAALISQGTGLVLPPVWLRFCPLLVRCSLTKSNPKIAQTWLLHAP